MIIIRVALGLLPLAATCNLNYAHLSGSLTCF